MVVEDSCHLTLHKALLRFTRQGAGSGHDDIEERLVGEVLYTEGTL